MERREVEVDGQTWVDGDYCLDRFGTPYRVVNCITPGGENTVGFESPPGHGYLHHLESPYFAVLRPLERIAADTADAVLSIRRAWAFQARNGGPL